MGTEVRGLGAPEQRRLAGIGLALGFQSQVAGEAGSGEMLMDIFLSYQKGVDTAAGGIELSILEGGAIRCGGNNLGLYVKRPGFES